MRIFLFVITVLLASSIFSQGVGLSEVHCGNYQDHIGSAEDKLKNLKMEMERYEQVIETFKLEKIHCDIGKVVGIPAALRINSYKAMRLKYSEEHEQAKWVIHMILPDIAKGTIFRSNDFREDKSIPSGTATQEDYFLTDTLDNGTVEYDGYGYDRGHLAPSADFRWSKDALSESYFYSNISPMKPEFNRGIWADLENFLRQYVITHQVPLYVFTAPVLTDSLETIERAPNGVKIPKRFVKCVYDDINKRAIGFEIPNEKSDYSIKHYAKPIAEIDDIIRTKIFGKLPDTIRSTYNEGDWFDITNDGNVDPIYPPNLPPSHFNTVQAKNMIGKKAIVCGTVVSTKISRSGNLWLNIDKKFPNQIFSVYCKKDDLINLPYEPESYFIDRKVCAKGRINQLNDVPTIRIKDDDEIWFYSSE